MKQVFKSLCIAIILLGTAAAAAPSQSVVDVLKRANDFYVEGKFSKAVILYRKALDRGAPPVATSINIGNCYYRMQKLPEAAAAFKKAVRFSDGSNTTALFNLAGVLYHLKQYGESIAAYHRGLELDDEYLGGWLYIAEAYMRTKDFVGAQRALEKARLLDPSDVTIVYQLAEVHVSLHEYNQAIELVRLGYQKNPEEIDFLYYIGDLYRIAENYEMAASAYKEGLTIQPDNVGVLYKLADVLVQDKKEYLAMEYLQKALQIKPDYTDALVFMGNLAFDVQWWDRAEASYERAVSEGNSEGIQGLKNLAYEFEQLGDTEKALYYFRKAAAYAPADRLLQNELKTFIEERNEL